MVVTTTHSHNLTKPYDWRRTSVLSAKICQQEEQTEQMDLGKAWKDGGGGGSKIFTRE